LRRGYCEENVTYTIEETKIVLVSFSSVGRDINILYAGVGIRTSDTPLIHMGYLKKKKK
jgi:hypothetical protein